jgi:hypothetical protein
VDQKVDVEEDSLKDKKSEKLLKIGQDYGINK